MTMRNAVPDANSMQGINVLGSIQMLGIMNTLKTGNPTVDTILAMILPLLMSTVLKWLNKYINLIWKLFKKPSTSAPTYRRTISFQSGATKSGLIGGSVEDESYNHLLIKAIGIYIHACCKLKMDDAELRLTTIGTDKVLDDEDQFVQSNSRGKSTSTAQLLRQCEIIKQPVKQCWHNVGTFDGSVVKVYYEESTGKKKGGNDDEGGGGGSKGDGGTSMTLRLESKGRTSIDCFVNIAYKWYKDELKKIENDNRYLYDYVSMNGTRNSRLTPVYNRYLLGEEKSFENLFCKKQTTSLLRMIDEFQCRGGKYGIPGFPHKLGILLHGPPGTGKTSLIKALAKYTRRQIVSVPLSRVTSNHALMAIMFNRACTVAGLQKTVKLRQKDVIFVLEDVDAASNVVKSRKLIEEEEVERVRELRKALGKDGKETKPVPLPATRIMNADDLSLSGLLNALDGVVDTPGRIVIMTTNHPEILDPALVRAGRIDRKIELGYMILEDAEDMIEHYFRTTLTHAQKERLHGIFSNEFEITPAEMEQLIMAEPSVDGMMQELEKIKRDQTSNGATSSSSSDDGSSGSTVMVSS